MIFDIFEAIIFSEVEKIELVGTADIVENIEIVNTSVDKDILEAKVAIGVVKVIDTVKVGKYVDVDNVTKDGKTFKLVDDVNIKVAAVKELEFNLPNTIDDKDMMLVLVLGEF
ncbi:hypothetical protein HK100_010801 [Physocladia obscura]|uniref:Uncharacterized protein n=1 Tax=Physocladia obscura TaxID=109957 RepID=A0AAD5TER6_9FUNG|nr:hypothetical protein HK100_010801 [Physocladia obscura]